MKVKGGFAVFEVDDAAKISWRVSDVFALRSTAKGYALLLAGKAHSRYPLAVAKIVPLELVKTEGE